MYTQCPSCRAIFKVEQDVLQASLGIVCCGNCGERFDALRTLSDRIPGGTDPVLPERDPAEFSPVLTERVTADAGASLQTPPAPVPNAPSPAEPTPAIAGANGGAQLAARSDVRARALIAEAAGIARDAILGDPGWQVTELPVLTAIILNEPISPADLAGAATVLPEEPGAVGERESIAPPTVPAVPAPAGAAAQPETGVTPTALPDPSSGPAVRSAASADALAPPADAAAPGKVGGATIATAALLRIEDAAASSPADVSAAPVAAGPPDSPPPVGLAPELPESAAATGDDQPSAPPPDLADAAKAPESPLERWLGAARPDPDDSVVLAAPGATGASAPVTLDATAPGQEPGPAATPGPAPIGDTEPAAAEPVYVPPGRSRIHLRDGWWVLGCVALALALALQLTWAQRAEFVRDPATRAWALQMCARFDCRLPPIRDVRALALIARDVRPDPARPGILAITATVRNRAPFRQPWPLVVVRMTDVDNRVVAMRRFRPAEYLPSAAKRALGIPAGATAAVALEVRDPGRQATGFRFDFE